VSEKLVDWKFGLSWLVACAVGMIIFGMAAFFSLWTVAEAIEGIGGETAGIVIAGALFGAFFALGASLGTGFLLQSKGVDAKRWIAGSVIAGSLGAALSFLLVLTVFDPETMADSVTGLLMGLTLGLSIGIGQWLVLRQSSPAANLWPAVTTFAFVLAFVIGLPLGGEGSEWLSLAVVALLVGAITALGAVWLFGRQSTAVTA
jgi:hypothetical protein